MYQDIRLKKIDEISIDSLSKAKINFFVMFYSYEASYIKVYKQTTTGTISSELT